MALDLIGKNFCRLTVLSRADNNRYGKSQWLCECKCGNLTTVIGSKLNSGHTQSCGCLQAERAVEANKTHGNTGSPEYNSWSSMIQRCTNKNRKAYPDYGGRGISVCETWLNSFEVFLNDMGKKPSYSHSIDRIDNNKGYYPDNCRWSTPQQQKTNQRACRHYRQAIMKSPNGCVYHIPKGKISQFSKEQGLIRSGLFAVLSGKYSHHHGWTGKYL
jgi:hypothetical protein